MAQIYTTLYTEEAEGVRKMHWMIKGEWYNIGYVDFASRSSFGAVDSHRPRIRIHSSHEKEEMKPMYDPGQEMNARSNNGLFTYYSILNRLFRNTICPRDGDPTNISQFAKNLLAIMRDGAPPFSVMDFVWEEIKSISLNPQKPCGFTPYLMFTIEDVTNRSFPKDGFHMSFRPNPTKKPLIPPAHITSPP
jgi:hypothetical protein